MKKIVLTRNLRKKIKQGHPWIYKEGIKFLGEKPQKAEMVEVLDSKKQALGWGFYDPYSPLALRILSIERKPPGSQWIKGKIQKAVDLRQTIVLGEKTNACRLINGEGDQLPGLVCDLYNGVAVVQFDGRGAYDFWSTKGVEEILLSLGGVRSVYRKPRGKDYEGKLFQTTNEELRGLSILENGVQFKVNLVEGQKTGFFLDQRDNRNFVQKLSKGKKVLNLFSYTGGFSLYAGKGGAKSVVSVDLSKEALELAKESWSLNQFQGEHRIVPQDIFDFIGASQEVFDVIIVDPPSLTHSKDTKERAKKKYAEIFCQALALAAKDGIVCFSSCSSHIHFDDFFEIIQEALSLSRRKGRVIRVSGQGSDHPFPHICPELRYLKFVSCCLSS